MSLTVRRLFHFIIKKWNEERGEAGADWRESLPPEVREWDEVKNSTTPEAFWKQMTDHRAFLGQSIRIPSQEAGQEDWKQFNTKLLAKVPGLILKPDLNDPEQAKTFFGAIGRPQEPAGYKIPEYDTKGLKMDTSRIEAFREIAHNANLTDAQFQFIVKTMSEKGVEEAFESQQRADENIAALKTTWGAAYDQNYEAVTSYLERSKAPESMIKVAKDKQLDSKFAVWLMAQHEATKGEGAGAGGDESLRGSLTPGEAKARIAEIRNNKDHAFHKIGPGHAEALVEMVKLEKLARGEKPTG